MSELRSSCAVSACLHVLSTLLMCLIAQLAGSKYGSEEAIKEIIRRFETEAKHTFRNQAQKSYVPVGAWEDSEPRLGISYGQLAIEGSVLDAMAIS